MNKLLLISAVFVSLSGITFGGVSFYKIKNVKTEILYLEVENSTLQNEIIVANDKIEELELNYEDCQDELNSLGYDTNWLEFDKNNLEWDNSDLQSDNEDLEYQLNRYKSEIEDLESDVYNLENQVDDLEDELENCN